ncbi:MAG: hypothetical protein HC821_05115 [Lewinella sp.]|nr:hypothetical protein [Lewinella sp.]
MPTKALFLCAELADYFLNTIRVFAAETGAAVSIVCIPNSSDAPYELNFPEHFTVVELDKFKDKQALYAHSLAFDPQLVYVAGWGIAAYRGLVRSLQHPRRSPGRRSKTTCTSSR